VSAEMMMPVGAPRLEIGGRPDPKHCHTRDHSRVIGGPDSCPGSACSEEVIGRNVADHSRHAATAAGGDLKAAFHSAPSCAEPTESPSRRHGLRHPWVRWRRPRAPRSPSSPPGCRHGGAYALAMITLAAVGVIGLVAPSCYRETSPSPRPRHPGNPTGPSSKAARRDPAERPSETSVVVRSTADLSLTPGPDGGPPTEAFRDS
jgi:hypothetical protein